MVYTLFNNDYNLARITKLCCLVAAFIQVPWEISSFALQYDRLQYLISEMEYNFKNAKAHEKKIYQRYVDKCKVFYTGSTVAVFFTAVATIIAPLIIPDQILPVEAKYPFDVKREPMKTIVFLHQSIVIWQTFSNVCHCSVIGLFIWFTTARFEILAHQFRKVTDVYGIIANVRQHIKLLRYAQEVIIAVRSAILAIIIICTCSIVAGGLVIASESELMDKSQFIILCIAAFMEVYACAWPADYLMDASTNIAHAVYESPWYNKDATFQRSIALILFRSQISTAVSVSSMLPVLSLNYYASYVSTAFSYLMTLRVIFVES
ncbi:odorant receptor 67a-like [Cataglyphis hispanica]|uniref:odorant receptor 67a-like n=1 Tax=Cataglyphis hispanica TaxID=1086592 RepID=UPI0021801AAE|nr:odorant receptor 67a-like [Cataglyphis hispanica]